MKTLIALACSFLLMLCLTSRTYAQADQATFKKYLQDVYNAYTNGDDNAMWAFYTQEASEISPDGKLTSGIAALKAGWDEFMKMVDKRPAFSFTLTSSRLITPDVALLTWDSNADIQIQGQQVGGPTVCMAVLHKIKGKWYIEHDSMTPVWQTPEGN